MEDWLEDLVDSRDRVPFTEIKDLLLKYGVTKEDSLALLFSNESERNILRIIYRVAYNNLFNQNLLFTFVFMLLGLYVMKIENAILSSLKITVLGYIILCMYQIYFFISFNRDA